MHSKYLNNIFSRHWSKKHEADKLYKYIVSCDFIFILVLRDIFWHFSFTGFYPVMDAVLMLRGHDCIHDQMLPSYHFCCKITVIPFFNYLVSVRNFQKKTFNSKCELIIK
ncbi:hypothetical protein EDEG_00407 [Edhazardia aedis USNM 41457]|uniref:Uncharacterized protein n=1 Tax=Edhazardia aedis (strain USNM 41457) TaxID=1003232 RepID=J9DJS7_EDHAE|nr:hypothetical protein EDEG_00407 [Edhazardia aedis USNM 41457]|eukprot:EJW01592.1 hypothetical protein EDEG_00407 [Edhazardia aedis USNM 41457]